MAAVAPAAILSATLDGCDRSCLVRECPEVATAAGHARRDGKSSTLCPISRGRRVHAQRLRNWLAFWRHETIAVPVSDGVDEIAIGLTADAYSRTALSKVIAIGSSEAVRSKHGLMLHPQTSGQTAAGDMLPAPQADVPALTIDRELAHIASRFDRPTAEIVALVVEYPWVQPVGQTMR